MKSEISIQLEQADKLLDRARQLEEEAKSLRAKAYALRNEALGSILPFKVGDVIEFKEKQGYFHQKRTVTKRLLVQSLQQLSDGVVSVDGNVVNAKGERSYRSGYLFYKPGVTEVKVLK